jgi:rod shape-determining protein MreB
VRDPGWSRWLRSLFTSECIVELRADRLRVRDLVAGKEFEFAPILAVDRERRVVGIGDAAVPAAVKVYEPFVSAAALDVEPLAAQVILQYAFSKLGRWSWLRPAPRVLLHAPKNGPGALDDFSDAMLHDLSQRAGALRTIVHRGSALSSDEALSRLRG